MTSPGMDSALEAELDRQNIAWSVMISDVQELISSENTGAVTRESSGHAMTWDDYHSLEVLSLDIHTWQLYGDPSFFRTCTATSTILRPHSVTLSALRLKLSPILTLYFDQLC